MAFDFEHTFSVKAPLDRVWAFLTDPHRVASSLPGAAITEKVDEQNYKGTMTVKVGPVTAKYKGAICFESLDREAGKAQISGKGQDTGGRGGANMKMTSQLTGNGGDETQVKVNSSVNVTGVMAQFGRGLIQDVSNEMFKRFSASMKAELEQESAAATASAPSDAASPRDVGRAAAGVGASAVLSDAEPAGTLGQASSDVDEEATAAPSKPEPNTNFTKSNGAGKPASSSTPSAPSGEAVKPAESSARKGPASPAPPIDVMSTAAGGAIRRAALRIVVLLVVLGVVWLLTR